MPDLDFLINCPNIMTNMKIVPVSDPDNDHCDSDMVLL